MSRFKALPLEKFFNFWIFEIGIFGKKFALYTRSLTKVPEAEEAGVVLVGMGREMKGDGFTFLQAKGWDGLMALCNTALLPLSGQGRDWVIF